MIAAQRAAFAQSATALPTLDFNQFTGSWYEIARFPIKREKNCTSDVVEVIALGDKSKQLQIVTSCKTRKGYVDVRNATARTEKKRGDGELKVTYLWPFSEKDWVLALSPAGAGPNDRWLLVGSPNHKALWIFAGSATLAPALLAEIRQKADTQGFATAKLVPTLQTGR
jgi:apolipoprotein D and lipocalin family protein